MPASNTRTAGGRGWIWPSSSPTRRAMTSFSLHVLTKRRYFCRLSKKRKFFSGSAFSRGAPAGAGWAAVARMSGRSSGGDSPAPGAPCLAMKLLTRSSVSGVTRAPSRNRATNLPSFTARRPKVDSAMPVRRQKSEMLPRSVPPAGCIGQNLAHAPIGKSTTRAAPRKMGRIPLETLSQDLRRHVEALAARERNTDLETPARYIEQALGPRARRQEYLSAGRTVCNVETGSGPIVVGAHYDTVPGSPGAD